MSLTSELALTGQPRTAEHEKENNIATFFSRHRSATRYDCILKALNLIGGRVIEASTQGAWSYTLYAGANLDTVVQFRANTPCQALPIDQITLAHKIHNFGWRPLISKAELRGYIGEVVEEQESPSESEEGPPSGSGEEDLVKSQRWVESEPKFELAIYTMDRMPGITNMEFASTSAFSENSPQLRTARKMFIIDFGRFMAQSWQHPFVLSSEKRLVMRARCLDNLVTLQTALPDRFHSVIHHCIKNIDAIFKHLPMTLNHLDLHQTNTLVDPSTCQLTAVIDWAGAEVAPFGINLEAVQAYTGYFHPHNGQRRYADYEDLHAAFWGAFWVEVGCFPTKEVADALEISKAVGLLMLRGFDCLGHVEIFNGDIPLTPIGGGERGRYNTLVLDELLINPDTRIVSF